MAALLSGVLPAAMVYVGKRIVDAVVGAFASGAAADREALVWRSARASA